MNLESYEWKEMIDGRRQCEMGFLFNGAIEEENKTISY